MGVVFGVRFLLLAVFVLQVASKTAPLKTALLLENRILHLHLISAYMEGVVFYVVFR